MKKIFIPLIFNLILLSTALAGTGPLDHFILNIDPAAVVAGGLKTIEVQAHDSVDVKTDYTGHVYLSVPGGGEVIVDSTGTSRTPALAAGIWNGSIRILRAGSAVIVQAVDEADASKTGVSSAVIVNAGPYSKLKMLVSGMTFTPGCVTGHAGTADLQATYMDFPVTVYACDQYYNAVTPSSTATNIRLVKSFTGTLLYSPSGTHNITALADNITFTANVQPALDKSGLYSVYAEDTNWSFSDFLEWNFYSLTDYYYRTSSPPLVTAGVPFGVTVSVSHFPPPNTTPDITFAQAVDIKAINTTDSLDADPVLCNSQLTPMPTPLRAVCSAGEAYFTAAYTKSGSIYVKPIQVGATPIANAASPSCYSPYITVVAAAPASLSFTAGADRLQRDLSTTLSVRPYDVYMNPVTFTAVNFSIVSGSGSLSSTTAITDGTGLAQVTYTAPDGNFENIISAEVPPVAAMQYVTILSELTEKFENWPNPFIAGKESTKINYSLPVDSEVKLRLYSSFGKLVWSKDITAGEVGPGGENYGKKGGNTVFWDGKGDRGFIVGAGVYILKMTVTNSLGTETFTRKIAVVK